MNRHGAIGDRADLPAYRRRIAIVSSVVASIGVLAIGSGTTLARTARAAAGPKPQSEITARRLRPRAGFPVPRFGARIPASELTGDRVFANARVGFALAGNHYGETLPARTTDGGRTWTIDGPQLHVDAADGAEAVSYVGLVSQRTEFAYGSSVVDVSTDAGRTWWETALGEVVTAVVPGAHGLVAFVQDSVSNQQLNPVVTWQYVSTDGGRHWRYSTSFAAVG